MLDKALNLMCSLSLSLDEVPCNTFNTQIYQKVLKNPISLKKLCMLGKDCISQMEINYLKTLK